MPTDKWIETKREYEFDMLGNKVLRRITTELETQSAPKVSRKEIIDIVLRCLGLVSIAVPILLFFFQERAEIENKKALMEADVYTNISTEFNRLLRTEMPKQSFDSITQKVYLEYYPKLSLLSTDSIILLYDTINFKLSFYSIMANFTDSLPSCSFLVSFSDSIRRAVKETRDNLANQLTSELYGFINSSYEREYVDSASFNVLKGPELQIFETMFQYIEAVDDALESEPTLSYTKRGFLNGECNSTYDRLDSMQHRYRQDISQRVRRLDNAFRSGSRLLRKSTIN